MTQATQPTVDYRSPEGVKVVRERLSRIALLVLESDVRFGHGGGRKGESERVESEKIEKGAGESEGLEAGADLRGLVSQEEGAAQDKTIDEMIGEMFVESDSGELRVRVALDAEREVVGNSGSGIPAADAATPLRNPLATRPERSSIRPSPDHPCRRQLAHALGVEPRDLEDVVIQVEAAYGDGVWELMILAGRTELALESRALRTSKWDTLESLAVAKLTALVQKNAVKSAGELLAIASTANRAVRAPTAADQRAAGGDGNGAGAGGITMNIFNNGGNGGGDVPRGTLPGAGDLGTIQLNISPRVRKQLESAKIETRKVLQESKMVSVESLREMARGHAPQVEEKSPSSKDDGISTIDVYADLDAELAREDEK